MQRAEGRVVGALRDDAPAPASTLLDDPQPRKAWLAPRFPPQALRLYGITEAP